MMRSALAISALAAMGICSGCQGDSAKPSATSEVTQPTAAPLATSDPDFSTWVAVGDWVTTKTCFAYATPPANRPVRATFECGKNLVARIIDGPYGNGEDFPFYKLDGIGWMSETEFAKPVDAISFVSPTHGWAIHTLAGDNKSVTYRLYDTKDGGDSWGELTDIDVAYGLSASPPLAFTDDLHGWMHVGRYNDASLLATEDGGRTWTPVWQSTEPYGNDFESQTFPTTSHGWRANRTRLERSTDGGHTWIELRDPCDVEQQQYTEDVSFVDDNIGWLLCRPRSRDDDLQLFRTNNGGETWAMVETRESGGIRKRIGTGAILTGMQFVNGTRGWISTSGHNRVGGLFTTFDGGSTWQEVPLEADDEPPFWRFEPPEFVDEMHGWVVVSRSNTTPGNIYRTTDGGTTWELLRPPGPPLSR
ncbi:MAG: hypothetical protein HY874_00545 [Chloroflexi bacterium]|nr:hypothetical protein [Chloroflexota bacterium]